MRKKYFGLKAWIWLLAIAIIIIPSLTLMVDGFTGGMASQIKATIMGFFKKDTQTPPATETVLPE